MVLPPLQQMRFRTIGLQSAAQATYGTPQQVHRHSGGQLRGHQGWDLEAPEGTPCYAIEAGVVVDVGYHPQFGNYVNLQFSPRAPNANMSTRGDTYFAFYAHLVGASVISIGSSVSAGQVIGYTGRTGNASGGAPHLHFEIHTVSTSSPGLGLTGRVDPGAILGYHYYQSQPQSVGSATPAHIRSITPAHHPVHRGTHHHRNRRNSSQSTPVQVAPRR
jgi:murein DD-endopeptidase MepM/ murein hydrolase activator NlpD